MKQLIEDLLQMTKALWKTCKEEARREEGKTQKALTGKNYLK